MAIAGGRRPIARWVGRRDPALLAPTRHARAGGGLRPSWGRLPAVLVALLGVGLLLYPATGNWFAARAHAAATASYAQATQALPDADRERLLAAARDYNDRIGVQTLTDPYTDVDQIEATSAEYDSQLRVSGSDTMARIRIPQIDVDLPVRHGTADHTLAIGVGHLQGSSLPVGGASSNAVLTGHSGLANATLFTDLHGLRRGDVMYVDVLGTTLSYEVESIDTVVPTDTALLTVVRDRDYLTLVTCTPIGVNSHRLIVRAARVPIPADPLAAGVAAPVPAVPFPWWIVAAGTAVLIGAISIVAPARPRTVRKRADRGARLGPGS